MQFPSIPVTPNKIYNPANLVSMDEKEILYNIIEEMKRLTSGGSGVFLNDILVSGTSLGAYSSGETIPSQGKTSEEVFNLIANNYVSPVFSSFAISGQATTVEVGTTLSGSKTFTWGITANNGSVSTIDIYDNTAGANLVTGTSNDGSQSASITTIQLNSNGATQSWKGVGYDSDNSNTSFNSSNFVVTGRFYRFFGPSASLPSNSAGVRGLPSSAFYSGSTTFTLATGNSQTRFIVALPPGVTITSVIDTSALNADITSQYILTGTISVADAGGTNRTYNLYQMTLATPYATSHNHSITIS